MSDSVYKFTYFDSRARGETTRMLFALADQKYEDNRIEYGSEQWAAFKPSTPFGQVPLLEVDGHTFCQTLAIERFVARKLGFYGKDELENIRTDMIVDCLEEVRNQLEAVIHAPEHQKEELKKKFKETKLVTYLKKMENMITQSGYFVGNQISWPDICLVNCVAMSTDIDADISDEVAKHPKLEALCKKVENEPRIAAWIAKRPKTFI